MVGARVVAKTALVDIVGELQTKTTLKSGFSGLETTSAPSLQCGIWGLETTSAGEQCFTWKDHVELAHVARQVEREN